MILASIIMQRQAMLPQIIHIRHNNKAALTLHAISKGQLVSVLGILKQRVRCIAILDTLHQTARHTIITHRRQRNYHIHRCRIATDWISHISTALAIFPFEIIVTGTAAIALASYSTAGLTIQKDVWLVISDHHNLLSTLQMAPPLAKRRYHSQQLLILPSWLLELSAAKLVAMESHRPLFLQ